MIVPKFEHWFSGVVWVSLCPTALTAVLGVVALPAGLPTPWFIGLLLFALASTAIVGFNAAKQAQQADVDRKLVNDLLARISAEMEPNGARAVASLEGLTSEQLRQKVAIISQRLREMQMSFRTARDELMYGPRKEDWNAFTSRLIEQSNEQTSQWQTEVQPEAVAVWHELIRRVYGMNPHPVDHKAVALEYGALAGPSPLSDAALTLEDLARRIK